MPKSPPTQVSEVMVKKVIKARQEASIYRISRSMADNNISCVVITTDHHVIGLITERDITRKMVSRNRDPTKVKARDIMSHPVVTVPPDTDIVVAARLMKEHHFRRFPVVKDGSLVGIITQTDVSAAMGNLIKHLNWKLVTAKITIEEYTKELQQLI